MELQQENKCKKSQNRFRKTNQEQRLGLIAVLEKKTSEVSLLPDSIN